jgi:hypothetical protein
MGEQLNKPGAAWGSSFSHFVLRGTTLKLRHLATSVAATTALALVGAAPAFAQETTINIRDSHVPTTAEGFKNVKCEGPFDNLDGDVDGWHFVLPGNDASFVSLTLTYDTPDGDVVATIASKSAGPGTRQNIDEFTDTTARGLERIGGASRGKAVIVLNPAEPPILMRNTIYGIVEESDPEELRKSIEEMVARIQEYVPGYRLRAKPLVEDFPGRQRKKITLYVEVEGAGDYLPRYAGNLDIMTSAAVKVGEKIGKHLRAGTWEKDRLEARL